MWKPLSSSSLPRTLLCTAVAVAIIMSISVMGETTAVPTQAPPTPTPTPSPATVMPTIAGTNVDHVIEDVMLEYEFEGVQRLSNADIREWEILTENWFNEFYGSRRRRQLHKNKQGAEEEEEGENDEEEEENDLYYYHHRGLQSPRSVRNMDATFTVQSQELDGTKNTLKYTQRLEYVRLPGGGTPEQYATLPWRNILANGEYGRLLRRNIDGFSAVDFPIGVPFLPGPTVRPTEGPSMHPTFGPTVSPTVSPTMPEINLQLRTAPVTPVEIKLEDNIARVTVKEWPQNGSLTIRNDSMVVYAPFARFIGFDSFVVLMCHAEGSCAEMAVTVQVGIADEDSGSSSSGLIGLAALVVLPLIALAFVFRKRLGCGGGGNEMAHSANPLTGGRGPFVDQEAMAEQHGGAARPRQVSPPPVRPVVAQQLPMQKDYGAHGYLPSNKDQCRPVAMPSGENNADPPMVSAVITDPISRDQVDQATPVCKPDGPDSTENQSVNLWSF